MSFKDLKILPSYDSGIHDVISDFYVPVLEKAIAYDRITGFFTSSSLAVSARGMLNIAENNGKIRIIASPKLTLEDINLINSATENPEKYIDDTLYLQLVKEEVEIIDNYRKLLAHWIANGTLEIRIALVKENNRVLSSDEIDKNALFHQKVGILTDRENNKLTFSGSINETFKAWDANVEEFKTFKEWDVGQQSYCYSDIERFNSFWLGTRKNMEIISLPEATKKKFVEIAEQSDYSYIRKRVKELEAKNKSKTILNKLFWYQKKAMDMWINNNYKLLFAMATGTGKTLTSIACIDHMLRNTERLLVIIATPQSFLSMQWKSEIKKNEISYRKDIICDSTNVGYKKKLSECISKLNLGVISNLIVYTTHATSHRQDFLKIINNVDKSNTKILFVGDEVHGLGSKENKNALSPFYDYRIGLSATPARWFDDNGSKLLEEYFGNQKFEFNIEDALQEINPLTGKTFLTPYKYHSVFVNLTQQEEEDYTELSAKIAKFGGEDDDIKEAKKKKLMQRANIIKKADNKLDKLRELILKIQSTKPIDNTIIFVADEHLKKVVNMLNDMGIPTSALTKDQGTKPLAIYNGMSERAMIIEQFRQKNIKIIVAIKCMDEGIDIPSADTAILMASTTNPREYIQRIGRVIRRYDGKQYADIYDMIVRAEDYTISQKILNSELRRVKYIVSNAVNSITELIKIYEEG